MTRQMRTRATLLTLLGLTVLRPVLAAALRMLLPEANVSPEINYAVSIVTSLLMFALPGVLLTPQRFTAPEPEGSGRGMNVAVVIALAVLARLTVIPLNEWWTALTGAPVTPVPMPESMAGLVLLLIAVTVDPAIAEEMFFRGALLTNLLRSGSRLEAVALTTLMFALMHGSLAGLPGHLIISLLLTLVMLGGGSLWRPVLLHLLYNLMALFRVNVAPFVPWVCGALLVAGMILLAATAPRGEKRHLALTEWLISGVILLVMGLLYLI